jgi:hypothetical protein
MATYEPPTATLPTFDSLVFQTPNSGSLTIAEGDARYLARTNIATSVASLTSFSSAISAPLVTTSSTINFTSTEVSANIDIGQGNLTNLFPAKGNIAIGNSVMDDAGLNAGATNNIGIGAGVLQNLTGGDRNVAAGYLVANALTTGSDNVIMGHTAGSTATTATNCVIIGNAANVSQVGAGNSIAIGNGAVSATSAIAIGNTSGGGQSFGAIAIGDSAGKGTQLGNSISIGYQAGNAGQGINSIAIGNLAGGETVQSGGAIAIGVNAGRLAQGDNAVAIGFGAGYGLTTSQGDNAIAIGNGAGYNAQFAGSIILSAGTVVNSTVAGFFVNPVRNDVLPTATSEYMLYNSNNELVSTPYLDFWGANITGNVTLAIPLSTHYKVTAGTPTITLPTASATYIGAKLTFRRVIATNIFTFNQTGGASVMVGYNAVTGAASFTMSALQFSSTIICDGTNWFQMQTA